MDTDLVHHAADLAGEAQGWLLDGGSAGDSEQQPLVEELPGADPGCADPPAPLAPPLREPEGAMQPGVPRPKSRRMAPASGPAGGPAPAVATGRPCIEAAPARPPRILLTGERARRRHLVVVEAREVWLPATLFAALCSLAHARCASRTGFAPASPVTICRLRTLLDDPEDHRGGQSLIETGDGKEYRLAIDPGELSVDAGFAELNQGLISDEERGTLLGLSAAANAVRPRRAGRAEPLRTRASALLPGGRGPIRAS